MRRISIWVGLALVLLSLGLLPSGLLAHPNGQPPAAPVEDARAKTHPALLDQWAADPNQNIGFMVYLKAQADTSNDITDWNAKGEYVLHQLETVANATQPAVMQTVNAQMGVNNVTKVTQFTIINAIFVHGNQAAADALARRSDVAFIDIDHRYHLMSDDTAAPASAATTAGPASPSTVELGVNTVHAPQAWAMGYFGQGVTVGHIDSGVQYDHPALVRQYRGNLGGGNFDHNYNWWDARQDAPRQNVPYDDLDHGTHTMGTILGEDASQTNQIGVAPGAKWIAAKVFPNGGSSGNEEITPAEDFMLAPWDLNHQNRRPDLRPQLVSNSWGDDECPNTDSWLIIQTWINAGIIPVFANGNAGPGAGSVGSPGGYPFAVGVGAINAASLTIAGFSSRGPSCYLGALKPDVVAPGVAVRSSIPTNGYASFNGTSMATPHVAGVTALLLSANPTLTYTDVFGILTRTATFLPAWGARPNNNYGWGLVQADSAIDMALHGPVVTGTVTSGLLPVANALVTAVRTDNDTYSTLTNSTGGYHLKMLGGVYTVTVTAFGYDPEVISAQSFLSNTTTTLNVALNAAELHNLTGHLLQASSCQPISGTVSLTPPGWLTVTAPSGVYTANIPAGSYQAVARAGALFQPVTDTVNVTLGGSPSAPLDPLHSVTHDFSFVPAHDNGLQYYVDSPAYSWISGTTALAFSDPEDGHSTVTLPFSFSYYGAAYTTMNVSTNGYVTFNAVNQADMWANTNIPVIGPTARGSALYPNNAIYPYWDDLTIAPRAYGTVYSGVSGSAPNRVFVIEWRGVAGANAPMTFEMMLEETTNRITFVYNTVNAPFGYGDSATIGIENATGTDGIQIGLNQKGIIGDLMTLRFNPGQAPVAVPCGTTTPQPTPTGQAQPTATACAITFTDVDQNNPFYAYIRCLACRQIVSGYSDGTFRWGNQVTRGQLSKIIAGAAGFTDSIPTTQQTFEDVPSSNAFWLYIERLSAHSAISGYACGGTGEPCVPPGNRPYFRWGANATRGQIAKIDAIAAGYADVVPTTQQTFEDVPPTNPFWLWIEELSSRSIISGYTCGGAGEPCNPPGNRPYFRWTADATRGQMSKIAAQTFYPNCSIPAR